jgi:hypothetical protein
LASLPRATIQTSFEYSSQFLVMGMEIVVVEREWGIEAWALVKRRDPISFRPKFVNLQQQQHGRYTIDIA